MMMYNECLVRILLPANPSSYFGQNCMAENFIASFDVIYFNVTDNKELKLVALIMRLVFRHQNWGSYPRLIAAVDPSNSAV
jgi:hypothetical protein